MHNKYYLLVVLTLTYGMLGCSKGDQRYREVMALPETLSIKHFPNPVSAIKMGGSGMGYTWLYKTTVTTNGKTINIQEESKIRQNKTQGQSDIFLSGNQAVKQDVNILLSIKRFFQSKEEKEHIAELREKMKAYAKKVNADEKSEGPREEANENPKELDEIYANPNDEQFYWDLVDHSLYTANNLGRGSLAEGEKVFELIYCYRFEAGGGGTTTYLGNSTGDYANGLDWALDRVGEPVLANKFRKIKKLFPRGIVPSDRVKRCNHMELRERKFEKLCDDMDEIYFELEDSEQECLVAKAVRWARRSRTNFEQAP